MNKQSFKTMKKYLFNQGACPSCTTGIIIQKCYVNPFVQKLCSESTCCSNESCRQEFEKTIPDKDRSEIFEKISGAILLLNENITTLFPKRIELSQGTRVITLGQRIPYSEGIIFNKTSLKNFFKDESKNHLLEDPRYSVVKTGLDNYQDSYLIPKRIAVSDRRPEFEPLKQFLDPNIIFESGFYLIA